MKFDLHMHSCASGDGQYTPLELLEMAKEKGLELIALSDHDSVANVEEMIRLSKDYNVKVIKAIECTTVFKGYELHCLVYGLDINNDYFSTLEKKINKINVDATLERLRKMEDYYNIQLDEDYYMTLCGENGFINEIVNEFMREERLFDNEELKDYREGGKYSDPMVPNFYHNFFDKGCPGYFEVKYPSLEETIKAAHNAGAIAILAHPWRVFYGNEDLLDEAFSLGLDGLEAYSNYHSEEQNKYYENYARKHDLVFTCGSDFHGAMKPSIEMGATNYTKDDSDEVVRKFLNKIEKEIS